MKIKTLFFVLVLGILSSCGAQVSSFERNRAQIEPLMAQYQGSHKSILIANFGPPDLTSSDGKGGEILIYQKQFGSLLSRQLYFVNSDGYIYAYKYSER